MAKKVDPAEQVMNQLSRMHSEEYVDDAFRSLGNLAEPETPSNAEHMEKEPERPKRQPQKKAAVPKEARRRVQMNVPLDVCTRFRIAKSALSLVRGSQVTTGELLDSLLEKGLKQIDQEAYSMYVKLSKGR